MKIKTLKRLLNRSCILLFLLSFFTFCVSGIGGGGILNDFDAILLEIKEVERQGLLDNPPDNISAMAKREIKLLHNSKGVEAYIEDLEKDLDSQMAFILTSLKLLFALLMVRIFLRPILHLIYRLRNSS